MIPWESCVLWLGYPLQNGVWPDVSKQDNDGILTGVFWEGDSLEFDGIDDLVNCGSDSSLNISSGLTVETGINPASFVGKDAANLIAVVSNLDNTAKYGYTVCLKEDASGFKVDCYIANNNGYGAELITSEAFSLNSWYHIICTYTGSHKYIYVNGVQKATATSSVDGTSISPTVIGRRGGQASRYFCGTVNHVRVYNKAFTISQVEESYQQTYRLL